MFSAAISNSTSLSEEPSLSSGTRVQDFYALNPVVSTTISPQQLQQKIKKKRSLPGNPDLDAEVIALSPRTLLATNRFVCEICNKGFQRDQNLQLHRRGHNLPWKLKQRNSKDIRKRAYVCPEPSCVYHHPSRALGDLTGIKKHYCRKHGEKKWKCEKCSKIYAVQSDWKAHSKTCGTREYRCDCGTLFSRKDSFITHRAFCDALAEESARLSAHQLILTNPAAQTLLLQTSQTHPPLFSIPNHQISLSHGNQSENPNDPQNNVHIKPEIHPFQNNITPLFQDSPPPLTSVHKGSAISPFQNFSHSAVTSAALHHLSATAVLQKAATVGATQTSAMGQSHMTQLDMGKLGPASHQVADSVSHISQGSYLGNLAMWQKNDRLTRDFLGLQAGEYQQGVHGNGMGANLRGHVNVSLNLREVLNCTGGIGFQHYNEIDHSLLKHHGFGYTQPPASDAWGDC
ncbi:hypothetical protein K2173_018303 [Erythroxylum novogranatense]|uniref:C2H2-type domain-containing protein n=1 Tax=Erythroxylum novogranatense TaxID=1862640 RepID=A0AAV8UA24_9ROSI|nr:hypothetical protein K2173_018303 [Erythroxylum novogranatense]